MNEIIQGRKILVTGIVQGVGFRPFLYTQAKNNHITGWVRNSSSGVEIITNGSEDNINLFLDSIRKNHPPLARIDSIQTYDIPPDGFSSFEIIESFAMDGDFLPISPDVSICQDCISELFDPTNRRYRYPFINCTNCGPRFTIIKDIPYDRPLTTMANFQMCDKCQMEYNDPINRRFHAQPIACRECGPHIWFQTKNSTQSYGEDALHEARQWIRQGKIIAVKGLGGFHLVCDGFNKITLNTLRKRKKRTDKPFALMAFNQGIIADHCHMTYHDEQLLNSHESPIVILKRKENSILPEQVAPFSKTLGVMLPYTPLHYLLLEPEENFPEMLIMTSGNMSEEPIAYSNESALHDLSAIADGFLLNNRDIETRVDDSVITTINKNPYTLRRSRGYAPDSISIKKVYAPILSVGAELKNTFCLTKDKYAFISHHIGDLQNKETYQAFSEGIKHFENIFRINPSNIACDLHPDYLSTKYAEQRATTEGLPLLRIQHHQAHLAACLAENEWDIKKPVIGVCFDGTGYGTDGHIWGGEFFFGCIGAFTREFHLAYMPLPGGDGAIKQPKRIAAAYLWRAGVDWSSEIPAIQALDEEEKSILLAQLDKQINCPFTSSAGRLFDAVASIIGIRHTINYEAQAAIELENNIDERITDSYHFRIDNIEIDPLPVIQSIVKDVKNKFHKSAIAAKFHNSMINLIIEICSIISKRTGCRDVALSGGVMQNHYLIKNITLNLQKAGFSPIMHKKIPANDGGISLGQAVLANEFIN